MNKANLFLNIVTLPARLRDRIFNELFSLLCGARICMVWSQVKIMGIGRITFGGTFSAGRGLWLETIGEGRLTLGANINISDWVHIGVLDQVTIGDGCLMGSKVLITDHSHGTVKLATIRKGLPPMILMVRRGLKPRRLTWIEWRQLFLHTRWEPAAWAYLLPLCILPRSGIEGLLRLKRLVSKRSLFS